MSNKTLKERFENTMHFVKPLYKKVTFRNKKLVVDLESSVKLEGSDLNVNKRKNFSVKTVLFQRNNDVTKSKLPGLCQTDDNFKVTPKERVRSVKVLNGSANSNYRNMLAVVGNEIVENTVAHENNAQGPREGLGLHARDYWLRVYPAAMLRDESYCSVIFRCLLCQLGLMSLLLIWTMVWVVVIYSSEEKYETSVSEEFRKKQNKLVIDLATELRQITPLSPKWRLSIEQRIDSERRLTELAVGEGARFDSGRFWNLSGTFLFTIYVMTALGFGAPVPNTLIGRTSSLVYAIVAVPGHIYLMCNASASLIAHLENWSSERKKRRNSRRNAQRQYFTQGSASSANSELRKKFNIQKHRDRLISCVSVLWVWRGIPLASVLYYAFGAIAFGAVRGRNALDVLMFPLEFTTTGGLEHVAEFPRILYGLYVEGAMCLLACALATLRRRSGETLAGLGDKYRLFTFDKTK